MESPASTSHAEPDAYRVDDLIIDVGRRRVTRGDSELALSSLSFDLLLELTRAAPEILTFDQLMTRVWPRLVVGTETVSQRVKLVREALGDNAEAPRYIAGVRGRGYRLVAKVTPVLPAADVPATQIAPAPPSTDGSASPSAGTPSAAARDRKRTAVRLAVVVALGLSLGYVVLERAGSLRPVARPEDPSIVQAPPGRPAAAGIPNVPDNSIAVLPFVDMSEQKNQEYFSDGLAEELIDLLTKVPGLQVSARTSSFYFKGQRTTIAEIAKALHVANVLEGSVRKSGDRVRVTAQLIRADNGYHRWSQSYDRKLDDIFKVQEQIAGAVAQALKVALQEGALGKRTVPANIEVYTLVLEGRYFLERHTPDDYEKAARYYRKAVELDSNYAPAWAGFSRATWVQGDLGELPWETARARARDAAQQAIRLDPQLPAAHLIMSKLLANDENWAEAARELDAALALDPGDADTLSAKAVWEGAIANRPDEAVRLAEQAVTRDPLMPTAHYRLCWIYYNAGRLENAAAACRKTLELSPNFAGAHFTLASLLVGSGQPDAALTEIQRETDEAFLLRGLAIVNHRLGRMTDSEAALARLIERYSGKRMLFIASVYAFRGEADAAFEWLERARVQGENQLYEIKSSPMFGPLKADPRYSAFLRTMKLPP